MKITKKSLISGAINTREIGITTEQLDRFRGGENIQVVAPELSADDREFLISGSTPKEWNTLFGDDDE